MSQFNLFFNYQGKSLTLQCKQSDTLNQVFNRYCTKADLDIMILKFTWMEKN